MLRGPSTSGGPWARYAPGMNFHLDATTVDVLSRWFLVTRFKSDSPVPDPSGEQSAKTKPLSAGSLPHPDRGPSPTTPQTLTAYTVGSIQPKNTPLGHPKPSRNQLTVNSPPRNSSVKITIRETVRSFITTGTIIGSVIAAATTAESLRRSTAFANVGSHGFRRSANYHGFSDARLIAVLGIHEVLNENSFDVDSLYWRACGELQASQRTRSRPTDRVLLAPRVTLRVV